MNGDPDEYDNDEHDSMNMTTTSTNTQERYTPSHA